jgi:predicted nuclease with RNAse H fold
MSLMRTAGIDLSSRDTKSAACVIEWSANDASISSLTLGVGDKEIADHITNADKIGIDVPLGWPIAFAEAVSEHSTLGTWPTSYLHADNVAYRFRRTDLHVWRTAGLKPPLSVSTDRIGIPAMRAAALLSTLDPSPPLDGSGKVVEVYPAAALARWGLPSRVYKGAKRRTGRIALLDAFANATAGWLELSDQDRQTCENSDDAFDALIAALVARAAAVGAVDLIPADDREAARREGWIALPTKGSLNVLTSHTAEAE